MFIDSKPKEETEGEEKADEETNGTEAEEGGVEALVVLAEEELVVIDLLSDDWKMMSLPYLVSLHASAVTCSQHVAGIDFLSGPTSCGGRDLKNKNNKTRYVMRNILL